MLGKWISGLLLLGLLAMLANCAPVGDPARASKAEAPVSPAPQATASLPAPAAPSISPEEDAWSRVVAAARRESRLNVYSFNMTGDIGLAVSRRFQEKFGIKVDIVTGGGAALSERIMTERRAGSVVADLMDANVLQISNIKDAGATVSSQEIPALKESGVWLVEPWANDPQRHILMHTLAYHAGIINTALVRGREPTSLKELAGAEWKGKMTAYDVRQNSGLSTWFPTLLNRKMVDLETVTAIGRNDIAWTPTALDGANNVVRGQHALYLGATSQLGAILASEPRLPLKPLNMQEGTVVLNRAAAVVKDGPHHNAAKLLIDWLISAEGQRVFVEAEGLAPVRKDVPDFTPQALRFTPSKIVVPTIEEERDNVKLFREGWLAKLWNR